MVGSFPTENLVSIGSQPTWRPEPTLLRLRRPHCRRIGMPCRAWSQEEKGISVPGGSSGENDVGTGRKQPRLGPAFPFRQIAALSGLGFIETTYLTLSKISGTEVACPLSVGSCGSVLSSPYAMLWNTVPLAAAGMLAYGTVAALSTYGAMQESKESSVSGEASDVFRRGLLSVSTMKTAVLGGSAILATTSAYLMFLLFNEFPKDSLCPWCIASAALSMSIAAACAQWLYGNRLVKDAVAPGAGIVTIAFVLLTFGLGTPQANFFQANAAVTELEYHQPVITTDSPPGAVALAKKLRNAGARMYGAFWCSHCYEQKQMFGKDAAESLPYVECFPDGWRPGEEMAAVCKAANLEGFPTWIIGSQKLPGAQAFDTLEQALNEGSVES